MNDQVPPPDFGTPQGLLAVLHGLDADLPSALRSMNPALAACDRPLAIPDWTSDELGAAPYPSGTVPDLRSPTLRRDFYTGEVFVERQSNFTLRACDLGEFTAVRCIECENFLVDLDGISIVEERETRSKFFLHFYGCAGFALRHIAARDGRNLALLEDCYRFLVSAVDCRDYEGYGLILLHSRFFQIQRCSFTRNLASGVMILGDCRHGAIMDCEFLESRGYYNWDAGLHICHCSRRIVAAQVPELAHEPLPIRQKTMRPTRIHVQGSLFKRNRAQGIYLEGARECLVLNNKIVDNNKEGICFDWGTALCVLRGNEISGNGYRASMTETEIAIDFVQEFPLLPDRSSSCKLPGISFDNGVLNAILDNQIRDNHGGGTKLVRAAVGNVIAGNAFSNNSRGRNVFVKRIYDAYILSLGNRGGEFDGDRTDLLEFHASCFNVFHANTFVSDTVEAIHHGRELNHFQSNRFGVTDRTAARSDRAEHSAVHPAPPQNHHPVAEIPGDGGTLSISPHTLYAFGNATQKHHAVLRLRSDGVIDFSPHPNESHWKIEGAQLVFFDRRFNITTRFSEFLNRDRQPVFVGEFLDSGMLHYLIPLLSTDGIPFSAHLPPLFMNAMPHCDTSAVERFFARLGWASTGLHCAASGTYRRPTLVSSRQGAAAREDRHLSFPQIASIIRPGQSLTGELPWKDEYRPSCQELVCIYCTRNLRQLLVWLCQQEEAKAAASPSSSTTWCFIGDPSARFLAFLTLYSSRFETVSGFLPWLECDRTFVVPVESVSERSLTPQTLERLTALGIDEPRVREALDCRGPAGDSCTDESNAGWRHYWSESAEGFFEASGLRAINERLGYEN